jgi:hypothetical protein
MVKIMEFEAIVPYSFCYKGRDGKLFFPASDGYYSFYPNEFTKNLKPPEIVFTSFHLADQIIKPGSDGPLKESLSQVKEIRLPYNQNVFSFDFTAIDYTNPEENQHLFMLENYDNSWHQGGSERRAYYFSVPPGKYTFRVKAANSNGVWAEKSIAVIITPHRGGVPGGPTHSLHCCSLWLYGVSSITGRVA